MTAAPWAIAEWSPFGVALEPVIEPEPVVEFGQALHHTLALADVRTAELGRALSFGDVVDTPVVDDTGAPVIEWAPATREQIGDGDTVRVTQVGTWKGTRLTGKTVTYERKPKPTPTP